MSVMLIVSALKYVFCSDSISGEYLTSHGKDVDRLMLCDKRMPLYELVEKIVNILFADVDNEVHADDMNYIDCFMDNLRSYVNLLSTGTTNFTRPPFPPPAMTAFA